MGKIKNIKGERFGKLTVLSFTGKTVPGRGAIWLCRCDCGNYREVGTNHLNYGQITMCKECVKAERQLRANSITEIRNKRNKLRSVWNNMKYRCFNPKCSEYKHYGGRGIKVCEKWAEDYNSFHEWALANGYSEGMTIERIDVNKDYCPENCRFIIRREQSYNKRNSRRITYNGKSISVGLLAYELGLDSQTVSNCLRRLSSQ